MELENVKAQNPDSINANLPNPERENVEAQNPDFANLENKKGNFPVLPFAITGGAILVSGIAIITVLAKRKKGKAAKP